MDCGRCGDPTILFGKRDMLYLVLRQGRIVREFVPAQRFLCKKCDKVQVEERSSVSPAAVEAVVEGMFRQGISGTASDLGCDRTVVETVFEDWCRSQEGTLPGYLPDAIGVQAADIAGLERLFVTDAVEEKVLEVFDDYQALEAWLRGMPGKPTLAVVDVDARSAAVLRRIYPGIELAVAPSSAIAAVNGAAEVAIRQLAREGAARGRNFREDPALATVVDDCLTREQSDQMSCWSKAARAVRRYALDIVDILLNGTEAAMRKMLSEVRSLPAETFPGVFGTLLRTWGEAMVVGVKERPLDRSVVAVRDLADKLSGLRAGVRKHVRAFALFSDPERELARIAVIASG